MTGAGDSQQRVFGEGATYPYYGRIIGNSTRYVLLGRGWGLFDSQVFHIAPAENDVLVYLVGRRDFFFGLAPAPFGTV